MRLFVLFGVLFIISSFSYAQTGYTPPSYNVTNYTAIPNNFNVDGQIYNGSVSGLRDYFDEQLMQKNFNIYNALNKDLKKLETYQLMGNVMGYGGVLVGSGLLLASLSCDYENDQCFNNYYISGSVIGVVGLLSFIIRPSRKQLIKFINKHNRINEKNKIDWRIGLLPTPNNLYSRLSIHF